MKVQIEGNKLIITADIADAPTASKSGKSIVIASTYGNMTLPTVQYKGKPVTIGLNAYVKP